MNYTNYRSFKNAVDLYLKNEDQELLNSIQTTIANVAEFREKLVSELKVNYHYIKVFNVDEQIVLIKDFVKEIPSNHSVAYDVTWLLIYASNEVVDKAMASSDKLSIELILKCIEENINIIGHRSCDTVPYIIRTTTIFTRMKEKRLWKNLYRKCASYLK